MGAFLAATTHAPLTSILMVLEMTASHVLVLPLMLACVIAYLVVRMLGAKSIYAAAEHRRQREADIHDLTSRSIATLLRPSPPTVRDDDPLSVVIVAFAEWRFQYLYVVDDRGNYCGSISLHDLRQVVDDPAGSVRAERVAASLTTPTLQLLKEEMTLQEALEMFRIHRGERLPVVDASNRLIGAVWKTDVLLELQQRLSLAR